SGSVPGRYAGSASETCDGAGRVADHAGSGQSDRQRESVCKRRTCRDSEIETKRGIVGKKDNTLFLVDTVRRMSDESNDCRRRRERTRYRHECRKEQQGGEDLLPSGKCRDRGGCRVCADRTDGV